MKGLTNRMLSSILAVAVSAAFLLTACGARASTMGNTTVAMSSSAAYDMFEMEVADEATEATGSVDNATNLTELSTQRKIIKNADLSMETMEYDSAYQTITEITEGVGGYIESSSIDGISLYDQKWGYQSDRYAHFTVRVPADQLTAYIDALSEKFNITNKSESGTDITNQYYDAQARLSNLEIQEKRLLELLEQAGALADLLEIERELADVRYEIETITANIKRMDSQVSYSTVNIQLNEVIEYQEKTTPPRTFGDRLMDALEGSADNFLDFCEGALFAFIYAAPMLLLLAVVIILIVMIIKAFHRRQVKKLPPTGGWQPPQHVEKDEKQDQ